jgi:hypothetical protein
MLGQALGAFTRSSKRVEKRSIVMHSRILVVVLSVVSTLALAAPAGAITVNVPCLGNVEFVLLAERQIAMEGGPVDITGNIGVNQPKSVTGLNESIHVGQANQIKGTAIGDRVFTGNAASHIDEVEANVLTGAGDVPVQNVPTCVAFPFVPNLAALTGVAALDFTCLPGLGNVNVPAGSVTLAPGCYNEVTVAAGATLNLSPAGNYTFRKVETGIGSTLDSPGGTSNLAVQQSFKSGAGSVVSGVVIRTPFGTNLAVSIGNNSTFNATAFAPNGIVHIHFGSTFSGEIVGRKIIVEPTSNFQENFCGCFEKVAKNNGTTTLSGGFQLDKATAFFLKANCDPTGCPGGGCVEATAQAGGSAQSVVLNTGGLPAGTYHVIAQFTTGTYCSADTITLP